MLFQFRPAGAGAPLIDPKPILDGWVQLEHSSIFRAKGENPFLATSPTVGQVLLESKQQLQQQVLHDPSIHICACGRQDIQTGQIDRRVLATLEFLSVSGLKPTVSALQCGHSELTARATSPSTPAATPSISRRSTASRSSGIRVLARSPTRRSASCWTLQGTMKPHQIISLMSYPGTDNTLALPDHYNHIHVGFRPAFARATPARPGVFSSALGPDQWIKLIARLGEIPDPTVNAGPSTAAIPDPPTTPSAESDGNH